MLLSNICLPKEITVFSHRSEEWDHGRTNLPREWYMFTLGKAVGEYLTGTCGWGTLQREGWESKVKYAFCLSEREVF